MKQIDKDIYCFSDLFCATVMKGTQAPMQGYMTTSIPTLSPHLPTGLILMCPHRVPDTNLPPWWSSPWLCMVV